MTESQIRRNLTARGLDHDEVEETIDMLAEQRRDDEQDRALEARLTARGYDLDELERDNPHNQWMYES